MSSSLPEQLTLRSATPDDAEAIAELARASETAVRGLSSIDVGDVRDWWRIGETTTVADGSRIVGAITIFRHADAPNSWGDVHPEHTGRGIGSALLQFAESRVREQGARAIRSDVFADDETACALLERRGYREIRRYYEMRVELGEEPPPAPEWPEGLRVEPFRVDDARDFHVALTEAFADEFGFVAMTFEDWHRARIEADDFDAGVWSVVRDGDEIAAVVRCDPYRYGGGWVGAIGVRKPWRRRGLGLALLNHTFRIFHARGERSIGLGVDAENPTGATRLYERAGMHVELETVVYERELE